MNKPQSPGVTTIDLLRHGECQGGEIYRGSTDVLLTDNGWQQMASSVAAELAYANKTPWQKIISSPLQRCQLFAQATASDLAIPLDIQPDFREIHFGDWEGRSIEEVHQTDAQAVTRFYKDPENNSAPNGESMQRVQQRLIPAWQQVIAAHQGEHLLLVQHGGTIRILLAWLLQMPLASVTRLDIHYASLSRITVLENDGQHFPKLMFLNRTPINSGDA